MAAVDVDVAIGHRMAKSEHFDVLIIGAGLSGIGGAYRLQERCPGRTFAIPEARNSIGGTWDLFRYPGVRSDSDMFTLGYSFRPWPGRNRRWAFYLEVRARDRARTRHRSEGPV